MKQKEAKGSKVNPDFHSYKPRYVQGVVIKMFSIPIRYGKIFR